MNNPPPELKEFRSQLLLAEAIALLHDLGKLHAGHLFKYTPGHRLSYKHPNIVEIIEKVDRTTAETLRNQIAELPLVENQKLVREISPAQSIKEHHSRKGQRLVQPMKDMVLLLRTCDHLDSGADRGSVFNAGRQSLCATHIATAFGLGVKHYSLTCNEERPKVACPNDGSAVKVNIRKEYVYICDESANELENALCRVCETLKGYLPKISSLPPDDLWSMRRKFLGEVQKQYSKTLGETRRAANDVTLWDHSYSVATLYKAALAGLLLDPPDKFVPSQIRWRIFRVGFDGLSLIAKGHRIGDLLGYRQALNDAKSKVKRLVEVDWALGNEVYRDENGIYFLVPALRTDAVREELEQTLGNAACRAVLDATKGEVVPVVGFGGDEDQAQKNGSRGLTRLGGEIVLTDAEVRIPIPDTTKPDWPTRWGEWEQVREHLRDARAPGDSTRLTGQCEYCRYRGVCAVWEGEDRPQVDGCPVCNVRPKCENQTVCPVCSAQRERRVRAWYDEKRKTTVWIDEIADRNDRAAVLIGRFDLTRWLDGRFHHTYLNSFLVHSLADWGAKASRPKAQGTAQHLGLTQVTTAKDANYTLAVEYLQHVLTSDRKVWNNRRMLKTFLERGWLSANAAEEVLSTAFERAAEPVDKTPENLTVILFRKHPSPARLRRIWETTEHFWEEVVSEVLPSFAYDYFHDRDRPSFHRARFRRLALRVRGQNADTIPPLAYEARIGALRTALYWTGERFITIDNLQMLLEQSGRKDVEDLAASLRGQRISLELPLRGQERARRGELPRWGDLTVTEAFDAGDDYRPFAHILTTPRLFITLVPGVDAADIVQAIRQKYEAEFSKVKNRLPLHLGVVYFHRRTPLYAAMDAARRMLPIDCCPADTWELAKDAEKDTSADGRKKVKLTFANGIEWVVDVTTGDPAVPDDYYPYFLIEADDHPHLVLKVPDPTRNDGAMAPLVHARDLKEGDRVRIELSLFDFEFLDTIGRRFEVSYRGGARRPRQGLSGQRPYLLDHLDTFRRLWWLLSGHYSEEFGENKGLTPTQLSNIETLIGTRAQEWGRGDWATLKQDEAFRRFVRDALINVGDRKKWWDALAGDDKRLLEQASSDGTLLDVLELYRAVMKVNPQRTD